MNAIVGKEIRVIEPTLDFRKMVESELTVNNPEFARLKKMGKWDNALTEFEKLEFNTFVKKVKEEKFYNGK